MAPVGAPAAVQVLDWLIAYGVKEVISAGCCGALTGLEENTFLIPKKALRDEGTSYHYLPPARFIDIDGTARTAIEKTLHGISIILYLPPQRLIIFGIGRVHDFVAYLFVTEEQCLL